MKMLPTASFALLLFGLIAAPPAQAQTPWELGPYLGVDLDRDELLLGAMARIHLASNPITLNPGIEIYPGIDDVEGLNRSLLVLNFDVQYQLEAESVEPYVGGGISWARLGREAQDAVTDLGLNLKGGLLFNRRGNAQPYLEAVLNFDGSEALIFKGRVPLYDRQVVRRCDGRVIPRCIDGWRGSLAGLKILGVARLR